MEHTWVEAYVDYIPSRGAIHKQGDTWIPLDASFKQHIFTEGIDVDTAVPTDFQALLSEAAAQTITDSAIPSVTGLPSQLIQTQLSNFQMALDTYISSNFPSVNTFRELSDTLHGTKEIIPQAFRFLPITLPVKPVITGSRFSEAPESLRHKVNLKLNNLDLIFDETAFSYSANLSAVAGKRITLSYVPATSADADLMSSATGIIGFPIYLVKVIPQLKIEGQVVATGNSVDMGKEQSFEINFSGPGIVDQVKNTIQAGEYYAVGIDSSKVTFPYLKGRVDAWHPDTAQDRDDRLGELLFLVSMFYFARGDFYLNESGRASNIAVLRQPSESMVGMKINANFLFNIPISVASVGLNMDVDRDVTTPISKDNNRAVENWFLIQKGLNASGQEHALFESLMGLDAISTLRFLDLANAQQVPIYIIDKENSQRVDELQIDSADKQDIRNFINAGQTILVPKNKISHFDYTGTGYIALDPNTGAAAYRISGGFNGSDTVGENVEALLELGKELFGKKSFRTYKQYEETIRSILALHPEIVDSPNKQFKDFTEQMLYRGKLAKRIPISAGKLGAGYLILYNTQVMLLTISLEK
jgi:hypothetical protein